MASGILSSPFRGGTIIQIDLGIAHSNQEFNTYMVNLMVIDIDGKLELQYDNINAKKIDLRRVRSMSFDPADAQTKVYFTNSKQVGKTALLYISEKPLNRLESASIQEIKTVNYAYSTLVPIAGQTDNANVNDHDDWDSDLDANITAKWCDDDSLTRGMTISVDATAAAGAAVWNESEYDVEYAQIGFGWTAGGDVTSFTLSLHTTTNDFSKTPATNYRNGFHMHLTATNIALYVDGYNFANETITTDVVAAATKQFITLDRVNNKITYHNDNGEAFEFAYFPNFTGYLGFHVEMGAAGACYVYSIDVGT